TRSLVLLLVLMAIGASPPSQLGAARTLRVSVSSDGTQANGPSLCDLSNLSANGQIVEFRAGATNPVPGDTNGLDDVFVHDVKAGTTTRVNVSSAGEQANGDTFSAVLAGRGRYVAFGSQASNLAPDSNPWD